MNFLEKSDNSNILLFINGITSFINKITFFILNENISPSLAFDNTFKFNKEFNNKYSELLDLRENLYCLLKSEKSNLLNNSKELLFKHFLEGLVHIQSIKVFEIMNIYNEESLFYGQKIILLKLFLNTYLDIYKLLFEYGLDPNQRDEDGKTIIIHLCQYIKNHSILAESLSLVLQFNPEKDTQDYFGHNAIDYLMKNCENNAIKNDTINIILNILNV